MIAAPLWVVAIIIVIGIGVNVIFGPSLKKNARERKEMFERRRTEASGKGDDDDG